MAVINHNACSVAVQLDLAILGYPISLNINGHLHKSRPGCSKSQKKSRISEVAVINSPEYNSDHFKR